MHGIIIVGRASIIIIESKKVIAIVYIVTLHNKSSQ